LQAKNDQVQSEDWENKLKALQSQLDDKEKATLDTQAQADQAMAEMGAKINVFKDPFFDRASETEDLMSKIRDLTGTTDDDSALTPTGSRGHGSGSKARSSNLSAGYSPDSRGNLGSGRRPGGSNLDDRLGGSKDHLADLQRLNGDLKAKADRLNDLRKKKDDLEGRQMKRQGIDELRSGLQ